MRIIGKVYANSMLVQINSRMLLDSEPIISVARFAAAPADERGSVIETHNRDLSVNTEAQAGPSGSSEPEVV